LDDHISWLIERKRFSEAIEAARNAQEGQLQLHNVSNIGEQYLAYLLEEEKNADEAASLCPSILGKDVICGRNGLDCSTTWDAFVPLPHTSLSVIHA